MAAGACFTLIELDECGEPRNGEVQEVCAPRISLLLTLWQTVTTVRVQILSELTGRATVPNVLVGGKSIGGGDELAEMQRRGDSPSGACVL